MGATLFDGPNQHVKDWRATLRPWRLPYALEVTEVKLWQWQHVIQQLEDRASVLWLLKPCNVDDTCDQWSHTFITQNLSDEFRRVGHWRLAERSVVAGEQCYKV